MGKIYDYAPLPGLERTGIMAPLVPVTFINGVYNISTLALVDSGAESGVISTIIADDLNIDWVNLPRESGLTMSGGFFYHSLKNLQAEIDDNSFMLDINIVEGINAFKCVLGRRDLFRKADINFKGYKNQFEIVFREFN